jgi:hypothetical protein
MRQKPHQWGFPSASGEKQHQLGMSAELRFLQHCTACPERFPGWLKSFSAATPEEDAEGVDIWAETDVGKLPINIKHSETLRLKFLKRENRKHIVAVVFSPSSRFAPTFNFMVSQLLQKRAQLLTQKSS